MTFGERIRELRRERGLSQHRVAYEMNISSPALSRYELDLYEPRSLSVILAFADFYNVSTDYLLGKSPYRNVEEFLASEQKRSLEEKIEKTLSYMENNSIKNMFMIPIYSKIIDENNNSKYLMGYTPIAPEIYNMSNPEDYFYLLVNDNGINLKVKKGDFALIQKQNTANDGDIVVVQLDFEKTVIRRWKKLNENLVLLEHLSDIQSFEPILIDLQETDFKIFGKVIGHFGKIN